VWIVAECEPRQWVPNARTVEGTNETPEPIGEGSVDLGLAAEEIYA
jgi:hypothetical protein